MKRFLGLMAAVLLFSSIGEAKAGFVNGGFETGSFIPGWTTAGNSAVTGTILSTSPTEGFFQAFMSSGGGSVSAATLNAFFGTTLPATNGPATEGSGIKQTVALSTGEVVKFDWKYNSFEDPGYDYSFVTINGAFTQLAGGGTLVTPYNTFTFVAPTAGNYTFGVGVVDTRDTIVDSRLLVDNFRSSGDTASAVPEPATMTMLGIGVAGMFGYGIRRRRANTEATPA